MNATSRAATISMTPTPSMKGEGGHRKHSGHEWREVLDPVDKKVKELVDARTKRNNHERNVRDDRRAGRFRRS
jgi:hypothetical protein